MAFNNNTKEYESISDGEYATPYNVDLYDLNEAERNIYIDKTLSIPLSMQNILTDFSTAEFIEETLGARFDLSPGQKKSIARIIRDILLGSVYLGSIIELIEQGSSFSKEEAKEIADMLVFNLFQPAIEDIKNSQKQIFSGKPLVQASSTLPSLKTERLARQPIIPKPNSMPNINENNLIDLRNK